MFHYFYSFKQFLRGKKGEIQRFQETKKIFEKKGVGEIGLNQ